MSKFPNIPGVDRGFSEGESESGVDLEFSEERD